MRPLDGLTSIKTKLGVVIVAAVTTSTVVTALSVSTGLPLVVGGIAGGLLALVMVQLLARGMTSPLREMAAAARAMATGDYDRRVTASSRDEVGELARAFNKMAAELKEVDRMRRDLVANVSHELRTPIAALQVVFENLVDGVAPPDAATLRTALGQIQRLGSMVEQLLDLSRLESGAARLDVSTFELADLIEDAVYQCRLRSEKSSTVAAQLSVSVEPPSLTLEADPARIHQVVTNLVDNALRHSPEGSRVDVSASTGNGVVMLEVTDEGPGIPEQERTRVFERFYRSDGARTSAEGGSGLGLAIAKWIVEMHGGDIRAEPRTPRGCRIIVTLPRGAK